MSKTHASLCTGFGATDLAAEWAGWENLFWSEVDDFCRQVLKYWFPNSIGYGDITKQSFRAWRHKVDVLTAGFPCQPFSVSGQRKGAEDHRYLWPTVKRIIHEVRPPWFIGENVGGLISMVQPGKEIKVESQASMFEESDTETILEQEFVIGTICRDLESEGYSVQPVLIPACAVGAPHRRDRLFIIAYSNRNDARRRKFRKTGCETGEGKEVSKERERLWNDAKRDDEKETSTNTRSLQCEKRSQKNFTKDYKKDGSGLDNRIKRFSNLGYASHSHNINGDLSGFYTGEISQFKTAGVLRDSQYWGSFPTQSPVCSRDDGISDLLDGITFSAWRSGSVHGYGNAIVPQVIYEIFKVINEVA